MSSRYIFILSRLPNQHGKGDQMVAFQRLNALLASKLSIRIVLLRLAPLCWRSHLERTHTIHQGHYVRQYTFKYGMWHIICNLVGYPLIACKVGTLLPLQSVLFYSPRLASFLEGLEALNYKNIFFLSRTCINGNFKSGRSYAELIDSLALNFNRQAKAHGYSLKSCFFVIESWLLWIFERKIISSFRKSFLVSRVDRDYISALMTSFDIAKLKVLPYSVELAKPPSSHTFSKDGNFNILFVGDLSYSPNSQGIIWFCRNVFNKLSVPNLTLTIVGKSPTSELLRICEADSRISLANYVQCLAPYYYAASICVAPIFSGSGLKRKVLEALSYGVPIVMTSVAAEGLPQTSDYELQIGDSSIEFLALIMKLYHNPMLTRLLSHSSRALVEKYFSRERIDSDYIRMLSNDS